MPTRLMSNKFSEIDQNPLGSGLCTGQGRPAQPQNEDIFVIFGLFIPNSVFFTTHPYMPCVDI
jgi:hypothetical protein